MMMTFTFFLSSFAVIISKVSGVGANSALLSRSLQCYPTALERNFAGVQVELVEHDSMMRIHFLKHFKNCKAVAYKQAWMNKTASKQDGPHGSAQTHRGTLKPSISQVPDLAGQHISCSGCLCAIVDQSLLALPLLMLVAPVVCKSQEAGSIIIYQQAWWLAIACGTWSF